MKSKRAIYFCAVGMLFGKSLHAELTSGWYNTWKRGQSSSASSSLSKEEVNQRWQERLADKANAEKMIYTDDIKAVLRRYPQPKGSAARGMSQRLLDYKWLKYLAKNKGIYTEVTPPPLPPRSPQASKGIVPPPLPPRPSQNTTSQTPPPLPPRPTVSTKELSSLQKTFLDEIKEGKQLKPVDDRKDVMAQQEETLQDQIKKGVALKPSASRELKQPQQKQKTPKQSLLEDIRAGKELKKVGPIEKKKYSKGSPLQDALQKSLEEKAMQYREQESIDEIDLLDEMDQDASDWE